VAEQGMPGLRRMDHIGIPVPDLAQAMAFCVDDIDVAIAHLRAHGVRAQGEPKASASGPSAGRRWVYFLTPWDLQCELVSYPQGKAYEHTDNPLWRPS